MGVTVPGWRTGGLLAKASRVARPEDMMRVGRAGEESESDESGRWERGTVTVKVAVLGDDGVGGEAARGVRGELAVCTLLLVLSGVGVVGLHDRLGHRKENGTMQKSGTIQVAVQLRVQKSVLGVGRWQSKGVVRWRQ
jgi:hypothetical protein